MTGLFKDKMVSKWNKLFPGTIWKQENIIGAIISKPKIVNKSGLKSELKIEKLRISCKKRKQVIMGKNKAAGICITNKG